MQAKDCSFTTDTYWFRYRAAAIIVENDYLLCAYNSKLPNTYYSVGGAVHVGETAEQAVIREVYEETGVNYKIDYLVVIHENLFKSNAVLFKNLKCCHELSLYFMMKSRGSQVLNSKSYINGVKEHLVWIPINDIDKYNVYPKFIKKYLSSKHGGIEHIVSNYK